MSAVKWRRIVTGLGIDPRTAARSWVGTISPDLSRATSVLRSCQHLPNSRVQVDRLSIRQLDRPSIRHLDRPRLSQPFRQLRNRQSSRLRGGRQSRQVHRLSSLHFDHLRIQSQLLGIKRMSRGKTARGLTRVLIVAATLKGKTGPSLMNRARNVPNSDRVMRQRHHSQPYRGIRQ